MELTEEFSVTIPLEDYIPEFDKNTKGEKVSLKDKIQQINQVAKRKLAELDDQDLDTSSVNGVQTIESYDRSGKLCKVVVVNRPPQSSSSQDHDYLSSSSETNGSAGNIKVRKIDQNSFNKIVSNMASEKKDSGKLSLVSLQAEMKRSHEDMKTNILSEMRKGFGEFTKLIKDPENGVISRIDLIEQKLTKEKTGVVDRLRTVEGKCEELRKTIKNPGGLEEKLDQVTQECERMKKTMEKTEFWANKMELMATLIEKHDRKHISHENRITANTARCMNREMVIGGIPETQNENVKRKVVDFIEEMLQLKADTRDVLTAYRAGGRRRARIDGQAVRFPKMIVVKCSSYFKGQVMKNVKKLAGKHDPSTKIKYFISPHVPEAMRETRNRYQERISELRKENEGKNPKEKVPYRIAGSNLFIGNKLVRDEVYPPLGSALMKITEREQEILDDIVLFKTDTITDTDSEFYGYATVVKDHTQVRNAYLRVTQIHPGLDHIMMAYAFKNNRGQIKKGRCDDGEHGGSTKIAQKIHQTAAKDIAVFVARKYGGSPLGDDRYKHIADSAFNAIKLLQDEQITEEDFEQEDQRDSQDQAIPEDDKDEQVPTTPPRTSRNRRPPNALQDYSTTPHSEESDEELNPKSKH